MPENISPAEKRSRALTLFLTFFKIGAFTFGGGYAMLPLIQREIVEKRKWITNDDILEVVAIAESTPGPIAVNSATFVGYRTGGFSGALLATLGVVLPSFAVILAISFVLREFESLKAVQYAFSGIRAGVLALVLKALWSMYKQSPKNAVSYALMAIAFVLVAFLGADVLPVIIGCAAVGLIVTLYAGRKKG
ncbi:MAG: chromate transporter [Acutalibacteraceae bacterium]